MKRRPKYFDVKAQAGDKKGFEIEASTEDCSLTVSDMDVENRTRKSVVAEFGPDTENRQEAKVSCVDGCVGFHAPNYVLRDVTNVDKLPVSNWKALDRTNYVLGDVTNVDKFPLCHRKVTIKTGYSLPENSGVLTREVCHDLSLHSVDVKLESHHGWTPKCTLGYVIKGKSNVYEEFLAFEREFSMFETCIQQDRAYSDGFGAEVCIPKPVAENDVEAYLDYSSRRAEKLMSLCPVKETICGDPSTCKGIMSFGCWSSVSPVMVHRDRKRLSKIVDVNSRANFMKGAEIQQSSDLFATNMDLDSPVASLSDCCVMGDSNSKCIELRKQVNVKGSCDLAESSMIQISVSPYKSMPMSKRRVERLSRDLSVEFRKVEDMMVIAESVENEPCTHGSESMLVDVHLLFSDSVINLGNVEKRTSDINLTAVTLSDVLKQLTATKRKRCPKSTPDKRRLMFEFQLDP